jgi:NAD(P)-dependent dehydrogenase (short-subunit alcohol dehydrogenase family)
MQGLKAHFLTAKFAIPAMKTAAGGGGAIVNLSSVHGLLAAPGWLVYDTLKHGVIGAKNATFCDAIYI